MAAKREIRTTLALDGEKEYQKALGEAQRGLRVLGSELKLASAEFETNGDKQAFLTAKSQTLRSEIAQQEEIVKSLEGAVKDAGEKYGDTASKTDEYRLKLNNAKAALERMRRELDTTDREAQDLGRDSVRVGRQLEDGIGDGAEQAKESLESMAAQMKQSLEDIKSSSFVTAAGSAWNMAQGVYQHFSGIERDTRDYRMSVAMLEQLAEKKGFDFSWVKQQALDVAGQTGDLEGAYKGMASLLNTGYNTDDMVLAIQNIKGALVDFPDTYTFDGLAEGLLQTIQTGTATGQYADLIQRLAYSTDDFNKAMKNSKTEIGDLQVALSYLSANGLDETAKKFEANHNEIIKANEADNHLKDSIATLGGTVAPVMTKITDGMANALDGINQSLVSVKENGLLGSLVEGEKRKSAEEDAEDMANYQQFGRWVDGLFGQSEGEGEKAGKASAFEYAEGFFAALKETFGAGDQDAVDYSDSYVQSLKEQFKEVHEQLIEAHETGDDALIAQLSAKEAELQRQIDEAMDGINQGMKEKGDSAVEDAQITGQNVSIGIGNGITEKGNVAISAAQTTVSSIASVLGQLNNMTFGPTVAVGGSLTRGLYDTPVSSDSANRSGSKIGTQSLAVNLNVDGKSMAKVVFPHIDTLQGTAAARNNA